MVFLITEMTHLAGMYTWSSLLTSPSFNPLGTLWSSLEQPFAIILFTYPLFTYYMRSANVMVIFKGGSTSLSTARRCLRDSRGLVAPRRRRPAPEKHTLAESAWRLVQVHLERSHISRVILALGQVSAPGKIYQMASLSHLSAKLKTRKEKYPTRFVEKLDVLAEILKM